MNTTSHIHISALSVLVIASVSILTAFLMHQASLKLVTSDNEQHQLWGKAIAAGFGY